MTATLRRYWFRFKGDPRDLPPGGYWGYGVTAWTEEDALFLIRTRLFDDKELPPILEMTADIDIRDIEANHVRPNIGTPSWRGIWYPLGFAEPSE